MKNFFSKFNAKSRQEFWLDLDPEDREGILTLAEKDEKARLFLENIRMSETIDPDDSWVTEGLKYCESAGGLKEGKGEGIIQSLMEKREELRKKIEGTADIGLDALMPLVGKVEEVLKSNNLGGGIDIKGIVEKVRGIFDHKKED